MSLYPHIFREYDIRGVMEKEIKPSFVHSLGLALGEYYTAHGHKKVLLAHDTRNNSLLYHDILRYEFENLGFEVISLGMCPSPCLYFAVYHLEIYAGVMVTASHNDAHYNGFKIWMGKRTLFGEEIQNLYHAMTKIYPEQAQKYKSCDEHTNFGHTIPLQTRQGFYPIQEPYIEKILSQCGKLPFKVVVDGANASAGNLCCELLRRAGAEVIPLYCEPTPDFPNHPPDPMIAEHCKDLRKKVIEEKADFGLGLDGDGDRLAMVDRTGRILASDELLSILASDLLQRHPNAKILADVKCSHHLFSLVKSLGGLPIMGPTGHSKMKNLMQEEKAMLGGELSGHFFHAENWYGTDDATLTAVRVMKVLRDRQWDLTDFPLWESSFASPESYLKCSEQTKFLLVEKARKYYSNKYPDAQITQFDGIRVDLGHAWFLIRASHTSPALTVRFEANTEQSMEALKNDVVNQIDNWKAELESLAFPLSSHEISKNI